jgi:hypothetical protein
LSYRRGISRDRLRARPLPAISRVANMARLWQAGRLAQRNYTPQVNLLARSAIYMPYHFPAKLICRPLAGPVRIRDSRSQRTVRSDAFQAAVKGYRNGRAEVADTKGQVAVAADSLCCNGEAQQRHRCANRAKMRAILVRAVNERE